MYLNPNTLSNQSHYSPDVIFLTDEQEAMYIQYNGFVTVTESTNEDGETTYTVAPDIETWEKLESLRGHEVKDKIMNINPIE